MPKKEKRNGCIDVWEPVEAWQVISVRRLEDADKMAWGEDGEEVLAWFDLGEVRMALDQEEAERSNVQTPSGSGFLDRLVAWFRGEWVPAYSGN